jgi:2-iminobutanoate/2-iminopropanoate deaminase
MDMGLAEIRNTYNSRTYRIRMSKKITCFHEIQNAPKAVGPYSPALKAGDTYFLSGQVGLDPRSGTLIGNDVTSQARQALKNLEAVLCGLGLTFQNVAKSTIFLTNMGDFQTVNTIYAEAMGDHRPARSTIQVSALPLGALVEIEMIAVE